jgi:hypothetical protein
MTRLFDHRLQFLAGMKRHDTTCRDRYFLSGLGIATETLAFLANDEGAEPRKLHRFASFKAIRDFHQHQFCKRRSFVP